MRSIAQLMSQTFTTADADLQIYDAHVCIADWSLHELTVELESGRLGRLCPLHPGQAAPKPVGQAQLVPVTSLIGAKIYGRSGALAYVADGIISPDTGRIAHLLIETGAVENRLQRALAVDNVRARIEAGPLRLTTGLSSHDLTTLPYPQDVVFNDATRFSPSMDLPVGPLR
ncbi:MAG: PRC-barrel domain-containing protein [Mangrovicoccus sp.]